MQKYSSGIKAISKQPQIKKTRRRKTVAVRPAVIELAMESLHARGKLEIPAIERGTVMVSICTDKIGHFSFSKFITRTVYEY